MVTQEPAVGSVLKEDQGRNHELRSAQAKLVSDYRSEPPLHVQRTQHFLQVADPRFDLYDNKDPSAGVPRDEVAASSVAEMVEADLRPGQPSGAFQPSRDRRHHGCVHAISKAVELGAVPPDLHHQVGVEGADEAFERPDGERLQPSRLGPVHDVAGQASSPTKVFLPPPAT